MQPLPEPIDNPAATPQNQALLYTYNFAPRQTDPPQLTVSYLLWPPLTAEVKCRLETEDDSAPQKQAFAAVAKDFIDDKLADALLYAGSYRKESSVPPSRARSARSPEGYGVATPGHARPATTMTRRPSSPTASAATC